MCWIVVDVWEKDCLRVLRFDMFPYWSAVLLCSLQVS